MGDRTEEVEITLRAIGPARPSRLRLPSHIEVRELRKRVAADRELPVEQLKLVLQGEVLHDIKNKEDVCLRLKNGDSLIVAVRPKPPAKSIRDGYDDNDEDDDLKFHIPQSASWWKRRLFAFFHEKMRLPDLLLMAIFSISLKAWVVIVMWFTLAPFAYRWDLGPIYYLDPVTTGLGRLAYDVLARTWLEGLQVGDQILGTGFAIILINLGQRQQGDLSAYSIFNEDFRELPGTLNADRLDRDIRTGQF